MKVFTVGLDQKPPIKDASDSATLEKTNGGSPPPGYVPTQNVKHIPLPIGPEIPQPPHPIIMRKSRGYKGILMVMLSVFLMALFALTLSEIAYNRQRDENFFRLRWAELKHRLGYGDNAYDYYHRANAVHSADRYFSLSKNKEMAEALIQQASESSSTTTSSISSTSEPVVAIDSFPPKPSSFEQQQQQGEGMIRDARLQFLKTILQKIKQHAEDMGFDGTMQVSVIEMEPQTDEQFSPFGGQHLNQQHQIPKGQSFHPLLPNFFPHLPIEDSSNNQQQQAPKSDSFMDGFGEYHQPTFMQNNQVVEQNRANRIGGHFGGGWPREEDNNNQQQQQPQQSHNGEFGDVIGMQWPRANSNPFRPESFFPPYEQLANALTTTTAATIPQPPHILPRPPSFDRWSGGNAGPQQAEGEDNTHGLQHQQQPHQPMIQVFPQQPAMPMLPPMVGPNAQNQQQQPEHFEQQSGKSNEHFSPDSSSNASPSQEVVGEIYGRKFGRMLQDIIANRIQGFQNMQQLNFIPPEDRIQVEPPQQNFPSQPEAPMGGGQPRGTASSNSDEPMVKTLVDNNMNAGPRGWTHQYPKSSSQQQEQPQVQQSDSDSNSQENVTPAQTTDELAAANQDSKSSSSGSSEQQQPQQASGNNKDSDDVWLVAPPHRTQPPPQPHMVDASTDDSSAPTPVDFPAVKFPTMGETGRPAGGSNPSNSGDALSTPQNDQQGQQAVHSNPVFFQVDDPSSIEQTAPRTVAA